MAAEIERRFLVAGHAWRASVATALCITQGYAALSRGILRVRLAGTRACLTLKQRLNALERAEYEYPLPSADAREIMDRFCDAGRIEKTRHGLKGDQARWVVDVFHGANDGLVLAEIELTARDERPPLPAWLGPEVTGDERYSNAALARHPFASWGSQHCGVAGPDDS